MKWCLSIPRSMEYLFPIAQPTSVTPVPLYTRHWSSTMYLNAMFEQIWTNNSRPRSSEVRVAQGVRDRGKVQMQLQAVIERVWLHLETEIQWTQRCTGRQWSSEFGHALGGCDRVNSVMHLEAMIERSWWRTWRQWSTELIYALRACDRATLVMHLLAMIKWYSWSTWRQLIWREMRQQQKLFSMVNV